MTLRYPKGEQHFPSIREEGKVYVDKTSLIFDLINAEKYVFLSRPRRFGKSLLLSTIESYFKGEKHLFRGLKIESLEKEWVHFPVYHFSFSRVNSESHKSLIAVLEQHFLHWEEELGINIFNSDLGTRFSTILIESFKKHGRKAVVLVDEYDNPLINTLEQDEENVHYKNRTLLKSVYSNLKDFDKYIRFGMLTGVSRFSKMSVFSGINNLTDITFMDRYATICGFTENEILEYLNPGVESFALAHNNKTQESLRLLKDAYDGYHFSKNCPDIYNPYSIICALDSSEVKPYWIETATPEFLAKKLKTSAISFSKLFNPLAKESTLKESDTSFQSPVALLFQTGYLTIKNYSPEEDIYRLGIPNKEVEQGLFPYLLNSFTKTDVTLEDDSLREMKKMLIDGNPEEFLKVLKIFISDIPTFESARKITEKYVEHTLYLIFKSLGFDIESQKSTSFSRMDLVLTTEKIIYVFELKLDCSPDKAIRQIDDKKYTLPFINEKKTIYKIGVSFSSSVRNITAWKILKEEA